MKRLLILSAVLAALLVVPSVANAATVHNYRIHDAGSTLVERYRLCINTAPGYEVRVRDRTVMGMQDGADFHRYDAIRWFARGCHVVRNSIPDTLTYEGTYFARLRLRIGTTGQVLYSGWHAFHSS